MALLPIVRVAPSINLQQDTGYQTTFTVQDSTSTNIDLTSVYATHFVVDNPNGNGSAPNVFDSASVLTGGDGTLALVLTASDTIALQVANWRYTALVQNTSSDDFQIVAQGNFNLSPASRWSGG